MNLTRYDPLYSAIAKLEQNHKDPDLIPAPADFPFKTIYRGQQDILDRIKGDESFCLIPHTGFGKTPVFLSLIRNQPALVIEPRKFLQTQVSRYYNDFVLFGRSGYHCPLAPDWYGSKTAAMAPCLAKVACDGTTYHDKCQNANSTCLNKPCTIFEADGEYHKYPCEPCEYMTAQKQARDALRQSEAVICNFGNFWNLLKDADTVVVDEADLFFREISAPMKLKYSTPKKSQGLSIPKLIAAEVAGLSEAIKTTASSPKEKYKLKNLLYSSQFLQKYADLCFMYQRKDAYFIEVDPRNVAVLAEKIFKDKRLIVVSATPWDFKYPSYSASIHQRCGIYFAPVGNLTSRSLKQNPYLMSQAAKAIVEISTYMELVYDADRVIIHCGNLGTHAASLYGIRGDQDCVIHTAGKLNETIQKYLASGKKYLLVASAEYGLDANWCKLQFILKFPYPNLDERMNTLKRVMGPTFTAYYEGEARTRIIQTAGRNVRGFDDFGITVCLDSKIHEDYQKHGEMYPDWFVERVDRRCY
jgi:hypothetical protein